MWMLLVAYSGAGFFTGLLVGMKLQHWFVKSSGNPKGFMDLMDAPRKLKKRRKQEREAQEFMNTHNIDCL